MLFSQQVLSCLRVSITTKFCSHTAFLISYTIANKIRSHQCAITRLTKILFKNKNATVPSTSLEVFQNEIQESRNILTDEDDFSSTNLSAFPAERVTTFRYLVVTRVADSMLDKDEFHLPYYRKNNSSLYVSQTSQIVMYLKIWMCLAIISLSGQNTIQI